LNSAGRASTGLPFFRPKFSEPLAGIAEEQEYQQGRIVSRSSHPASSSSGTSRLDQSDGAEMTCRVALARVVVNPALAALD
jgi:hypothetical protein